MKIWPFLITKNKSLGYQVVVAPDFLVDARKAGILLYVTEGDLSEKSEAYVRQIIDRQRNQTVTVVYRIRNAINDRGDIRKDGFGRSVTETIGAILPEELPSRTIPMPVLERVFQTLDESIQQFWRAEAPFPAVKASALDWPLQNASAPYYTLINLSPYLVNEAEAETPLESDTKIETHGMRDSQQNTLLGLFVSLWNWLTNKQ